MTRNSKKRAILVISAVAAATGMANAGILYDTLPTLITEPNTGTILLPGAGGDYRLVPAFIGASGVFGTSLDVQVADDFGLSQAYFIDRVTVDMNSNPGHGPLPETVMVEFFSDAGGRPGDAAHYSMSVGSDRLTRESSLGGPGDVVGGFRMGVDLSGLGIELGAGNWWFSVVGIADDYLYTAVRRGDQTTGEAIHLRNGGLAHGNGYPVGPWGSYEWTTLDAATGFGLHGDLNARIEGTLVPAPGGAAVLGLLGLAACRRRRSALN